MKTSADRLALLRRHVLRAASALSWLPPTVARLTLGWVFLQSGWGKLRGLPRVIEYFGTLGIPAPQIQAPLAAGTELVCGVLLLLGLGTRAASLPLIVVMAVAIGTARRSEIGELSDLFGFAEYLYIALCLYLAAGGAGPISLDRLVAKRLDAASSAAPPTRGAAGPH